MAKTATARAKKVSDKKSLAKPLAWIMIIGGFIGLICSFIILHDKIELLKNPAFQPSCNLNPVIACGNIMKSAQSNAFGFTNPIIGMAAFPVLMTIGVASLMGNTFKRWFWLAIQIGTVFGIGFVHWLFFESVYRIGSLCPYCMVVWVVTITTFWYVLLHNLETGVIKLPAKLAGTGRFVRKHHLDILVLWLIIIAGLILHHFWYYYGAAF